MIVRLRRPLEQDAEALMRIWPAQAPLPGYRLPENLKEMQALIEEWNRGEVRGRRFEMLLIEADGVPAGLISLYEGEGCASFGISVHPSLQRRGIGRRATELAAEHACALGCKRLNSQCLSENEASIALHEACGFIKTGEFINAKGKRVIGWTLPTDNQIKTE